MSKGPSPFGVRLRSYRRRAGLSQLELAQRARTTARHLSFVETGRSRPGEELVLRLGRALDLSLRERNALSVAAGLAPHFAEAPLDGPALASVRAVVERVLAGHEPFPAWAFRRGMEPVLANAAAERLFPGLTAMRPEAIVDAWFGPGPFRAMVENWADVVATGIDALRRDAAEEPDGRLDALLARAIARAGGEADLAAPSSYPVVCPRFVLGGRAVRTLSAVMRFDTATDLTVADLRIELMFPADEASAAFFRGA